MDSRYGRDDYLLIFHAHFAAMVYGEVVEWWSGGGAFDRVWRAGLCNQDLTLVLQEDAPRVIFACVCASEGMD